MTERLDTLETALRRHLSGRLRHLSRAHGELAVDVAAEDLLVCAGLLRDESELGFEQLVDLCGVDYSQYGRDEWATTETTGSGFSRGVAAGSTGRLRFGDELPAADNGRPRFAAVIHLLSYRHNWRLRLRCHTEDDEFPRLPSLCDIWPAANWYEREAFDLFGIVFDDHPDLRRLLTDYGFVGHPFRKDFPLIGHVEMRYDPEQGRVVYQPVSIEPRVLVPRVIRRDNRYLHDEAESAAGEGAGGA